MTEGPGQSYIALDLWTGKQVEVDPSEADDWNERGYEILELVNRFGGDSSYPPEERVDKVCAWAVTGIKREWGPDLLEGLMPSWARAFRDELEIGWNAREASVAGYDGIARSLARRVRGVAVSLYGLVHVPSFIVRRIGETDRVVREVWLNSGSYSESQVVHWLEGHA